MSDKKSKEVTLFISLCPPADQNKIKSKTLTYEDFDRLNLIINRLDLFDAMLFLVDQYPEYATRYLNTQARELEITSKYPAYYCDEIFPVQKKWMKDFYDQLSPKDKLKYKERLI